MYYNLGQFFLKKVYEKKQPPELFYYETALFKKITIFAGKQLCRSLFLINLTQVFSSEYCEIFQKTCFEKHLRTTTSLFIAMLPCFKWQD